MIIILQNDFLLVRSQQQNHYLQTGNVNHDRAVMSEGNTDIFLLFNK